MKIKSEFWKGKKVFITGHTGFKGTWMTFWLVKMGAIVHGFSIDIPTNPSLYEKLALKKNIIDQSGDICDLNLLQRAMIKFNPDIVIHMAAQSLVRASYNNPIETYNTNVLGTVNVLEASRKCNNLKVIISVTSDKCYENKEWNWSYREIDRLGGYDPYSNSKACAELAISAYRKSFLNSNGITVASVRAGNVIGGGDWAQDRLIPDILRSFEAEKQILIRNPNSIRPWQHVLEPISGYLHLAKLAYEDDNLEYSRGWNFGPNADGFKSVEWIVNRMKKYLGEDLNWKLDISNHPHEAKMLKLDISDSKEILNWSPALNLKKTIKRIIFFHKNYMNGNDLSEVCNKEIEYYERR